MRGGGGGKPALDAMQIGACGSVFSVTSGGVGGAGSRSGGVGAGVGGGGGGRCRATSVYLDRVSAPAAPPVDAVVLSRK